MFLRNGILSDKQFFKHYGKDIFIYPFQEENLKGASYNLTASRVAFYKDDKDKLVSALVTKNKISIPPEKLIFIQTEEVIYVNQRICGTYHSKVKWVSRGLSSISTTLDPCYFGTSLVTVKNLTKKTIEIDVGETFCTIIFHKITSANKDSHDNPPFRKDLESGRIYDFSNMYEYKKLQNKNRIQKLNEELSLNELKKQNNIKKYQKQKEIYKLKNDLRKKELKNLLLQYKNYLEEWYEDDIKRSKKTLIKKIKQEVKLKNQKKIEMICSSLLIILEILILIYIYLYTDEKEKGLKIPIITGMIGLYTFVHIRIVNFLKELWYFIDNLIYEVRDIF